MKRIFKLLGVVLVALFIWYFFIKQHDYQVRFQTGTTPGTVSQSLKTWVQVQEGGRTLAWEGTERVSQRLVFGDSAYTYTWDIKPEHDSLSTVTAYISDNENSFQNKIKILFSDTDFEKRSRNTVREFGETMLGFLKETKVNIIGEAETPDTFCACAEVETSQTGKAGGMMEYYGLLNSVIVGNDIQLNGPPLLRVREWDQEKDSLLYDFCYPIIRSERLPRIQNITYKRLFKQPALKAHYNGNYITSDRAWYALMAYAKSNNLKVSGLPIEVFFNNPNSGLYEKDWLAEIYMPILE